MEEMKNAFKAEEGTEDDYFGPEELNAAPEVSECRSHSLDLMTSVRTHFQEK